MAFTKRSAAVLKPEAGKVGLTASDRLLLLGMLPKEANLITLRVVRDLQSELSFSEGEIKALNFREMPGGGVQWDVEGDTLKMIHLGGAALGMIKETFAKMDEEGKLTLAHLELYEKLGTRS